MSEDEKELMSSDAQFFLGLVWLALLAVAILLVLMLAKYV